MPRSWQLTSQLAHISACIFRQQLLCTMQGLQQVPHALPSLFILPNRTMQLTLPQRKALRYTAMMHLHTMRTEVYVRTGIQKPHLTWSSFELGVWAVGATVQETATTLIGMLLGMACTHMFNGRLLQIYEMSTWSEDLTAKIDTLDELWHIVDAFISVMQVYMPVAWIHRWKCPQARKLAWHAPVSCNVSNVARWSLHNQHTLPC